MALDVTAIYAALIAVIFLVLSFRVILYRRANRLSLGDYGDKALMARMRVHANCAEYAPIGLILLALAELQGTPTFVLHILGLMLLLGRAAHAYGFSQHPQDFRLRVGGMMLTTVMIGLTALGLLAHAVWPG